MKAYKAKTILCAAVLALTGTAACFPAIPVSAAVVQENETGVYNGMKYEVMGSYCLITGYTDALPEELVIPEKINGKNVEWVHIQAFENCTKLKSVTLPKTIQVLNFACFSGCTSLETVNLPEEMKSLRSISGNAFEGTPWLEAQRKKTPLIIFGNILYDGVGSSGDVVIPEEVHKINEWAFRNNKALTSVKFSSALEKIEDNAFEGCTGLKSVTIPGTVDTVDEDVFRNCTGLETVIMESGVSKLDGGAFSGCTALKTIEFPDTLLFISDGGFYGVFQGCESLEEVVLPASLRTVWKNAFTECTNLKSITFPNYYTEFSDSKAVISNVGGGFMAKDEELDYSGVIRGYEGSSAQTYADKYGYRFESLGDYPTSGKSGGNTTWSFDGDTLTLAGSGDLDSYLYPLNFDDEYSYQGVAPWFYYHDKIKHIVIGKDITALASGLFAWMTSLESVTVWNPSLSTFSFTVFPKKGKDQFPDDLLIRGYKDSAAQQYAEQQGYRFEALEGDPPVIETVKTGTCGEKLNWKLDTKALTLEITGTGDMTDFDANNTPSPWLEDGLGGGIQTVSIADGVTGIGAAAFALNCRIEEITLPASVKRIGSYAFELMGDLKTLTILNPDCEIPDDEFTICSAIKNNKGVFDGTIRGYAGSTAEKYAEKFGCKFEAIAPSAEAVNGDADGDGAVSSADAQLALQAYTAAFSGMDSGLTEAQLKAADVNGDNEVSVEDAQLILLYYTENYVAMNKVTWQELMDSLKK